MDALLLQETDDHKASKRWVMRTVWLFVWSLFVVLLLILVTVLYQNFFYKSPIKYQSTDIPHKEAFCVGDEYSANGKMEIDEPMILYTYIAVYDKTGHTPLLPRETSFPPVPIPRETEFFYHQSWQIPNLSPGTYTRVLSFRSGNYRQDTIFNEMLFSVKGCRR